MKRLLVFFSLVLCWNSAYSSVCGSVYNIDNGPWDYSSGKDRATTLKVVEKRHFTPRVENLIRGESSKEVMDDLAYTLNKFPNHYRALYSLIRYDEKLNGVLPKVPKYPFPQTVNCYFERAFQLRTDDPYIHQLYGIYLYKKSDFEKSKESFIKSESIKATPEIHYNLGLVYFELGDLEKAKQYAQKAYSEQYPIQGLKRKLKSRGVDL